jgi:uncharacterized protein YidB (DUF937 family)
MGFLDEIMRAATAGQGGAGAVPASGGDQAALVRGVLDMLGGGAAGGAAGDGLAGLARTFQSHGLERQFQSWVSTGENEPIDPAELGRALGPETTQRLSSGAGMALQAALPLLAQLLPVIIDRLTPQGQMPARGAGGLQDMLGSLLSGGPR